MSDEPKKVWVNVFPQLLGIAALVALLLAGIRSDRPPESTLSRLQRAARLLRVGMTAPEMWAETEFVKDIFMSVGGTSHFHFALFYDPRRQEFLHLRFAAKHNPLTGDDEMLLTDWDVSKR
jgi:hypothetical protein